MACQEAEISWRDGTVPVSDRFDDPYFSVANGYAETCHVFLDGNGLPERLTDGFHVAELGFGTGLNLLALWQVWQESGRGGKIRFTSFEAFPMSPADMERAHAAFPALARNAALLREALCDGAVTVSLPGLDLELIVGDARQTLPKWAGRADAWFLDGFSPAKNPELWGPSLLAEVARHTGPGGTASTYSAAGHVRRALQEAGFEVTRAPGFGRKRHMTRARLP